MQKTKAISSYKENLRTKILDAAMAAFTKRGIHAVTMDDVATALKISKRTLYQIYENKEQLLYEAMVREMTNREENIRTELMSCRNVMEILLTIYKRKVDEYNQTNPSFYSDLVKYPRVQEYLKSQNLHTRVMMNGFFKRGVEEGYFRDNIDYKLARYLFDGMGKIVQDNKLYQYYSMKDIFNNLVFVSLRGLCTEKGISAIDKMI